MVYMLLDQRIVYLAKTASRLLLSKKFDSLILTGDFNFPNVKWHHDGSSDVFWLENNTSERLTDMLADEALTQFVTSPTFIQSDGSFKNTLDYIVSDNCRRVVNLETGARIGNTKQAHLTMCWDLLECEPSTRFSSIKYNINKDDYVAINGNLNQMDFSSFFKDEDADAGYEYFLSTYHDLCDKCIPRKKKMTGPKNNAPWLTPE